MREHGTTSQAPCFIQWTRNIQLGLFATPAADARRAQNLLLRRGTLAHQIDGTARLPIAAEQAVGAAHHLHAVIHGQIGVEQLLAESVHAGSVDLHIADLEAARQKFGGRTAQSPAPP
jgi:hypothetical protein